MTPFVQTSTDFIRTWMPWITVGGILWRGYSKAKGSINSWADTLLTNHLHHLQLSMDEQTKLLQKIADK